MNQVQRINYRIESRTIFKLVWFISNPNSNWNLPSSLWNLLAPVLRISLLTEKKTLNYLKLNYQLPISYQLTLRGLLGDLTWSLRTHSDETLTCTIGFPSEKDMYFLSINYWTLALKVLQSSIEWLIDSAWYPYCTSGSYPNGYDCGNGLS